VTGDLSAEHRGTDSIALLFDVIFSAINLPDQSMSFWRVDSGVCLGLSIGFLR
jgi:hypothetical protein